MSGKSLYNIGRVLGLGILSGGTTAVISGVVFVAISAYEMKKSYDETGSIFG